MNHVLMPVHSSPAPPGGHAETEPDISPERVSGTSSSSPPTPPPPAAPRLDAAGLSSPLPSLAQPTGVFYRFFDLPGELREQILRYVCFSPTGYLLGEPPYPSTSFSLSPSPSSGSSPSSSDHDGGVAVNPPAASAPLGLFLASSATYHESSAVFLGQNTFHLNLVSRRRRTLAPILDADFGLLTSASALQARRRLRRLVLYARRIGGLFADKLLPALEDMVLGGGLRDLELRVRAPVRDFNAPFATHRRHDAADDDRIISSRPFRGLVRLLADPDLERAAVRVERVHWSLWCPFHERCARERTVMEGVFAETREEWLSVDVDKLVAAYGGVDPEWRVVRIGT